MCKHETSICRPRAVLNANDAVEIYKFKTHSFDADRAFTGHAPRVAEIFNVSPKTIRDIWNRRTWIPETRHLWVAGEMPALRKRRSISSISLEDKWSATTITRVSPTVGENMLTGDGHISAPQFWYSLPDKTVRIQSRSSADDEQKLPNVAEDCQREILKQENSTSLSEHSKLFEKFDADGLTNWRQKTSPGDDESTRNDPFHYDWPYW